MIDINNILQWKHTYGEIYQMEILGQHFIFRALGREEYKGIVLMDLELGDFQEAICFSSIIYPDNYDYTRGIAGVAEVLSDGILDASGLHMGQAKELLDNYRDEMYNYDYQVDVLIHEAFPEFTLEEIATWPVRKTMFYLSRAEWILRNLKGVMIQTIDEAMQEQLEYEQQMQQEQEQQGFTPTDQMPPEFAEQIAQQQQQEQLATGEQLAQGNAFGFDKPPAPPKKSTPEGGIQSEEELLAMLAGTGKGVSKPITNLSNEVTPELNWFGYMDELKGEFD
jgi:hypothetical protein